LDCLLVRRLPSVILPEIVLLHLNRPSDGDNMKAIGPVYGRAATRSY
jgi:hypothetical protein